MRLLRLLLVGLLFFGFAGIPTGCTPSEPPTPTDTETKDTETKDTETKDTETKDTETKDTETKDTETK